MKKAKAISELDALRLLERRVKRVVWYDWSGNDQDAAESIDKLREAYEDVQTVRKVLRSVPSEVRE